MLENTQGTHYLIVDDEEGMRTLLRILLEHNGCMVLTASSSQQALNLLTLHGSSIRAAIIDLNLRGQRGEELFDEIEKTQKDLPTIFISGSTRKEMLERIGYRNIAGLITKPFQTHSLVDTLRNKVDSFIEATLLSQRV